MIETGLQGRVVIVTGAATGIGKATARRFAEEGCRVASWDKENGTPEQCGIFQKVDVTDAEAVDSAAAEVVERLGTPYVLVNNAGILRDSQLVKFKDGKLAGGMSDEMFCSVIDVNLRGVFLCTRAVAAHMVAGGEGGVILSSSSVVQHNGNFGQTSYVAAKTGVVGMTRVWARELAKYKIRVNAVAPGFTATNMVQAMPAPILQNICDHTLMRRLGKPEEIANAYVWLASDAASFVHGALLSVDGGLVMGT